MKLAIILAVVLLSTACDFRDPGPPEAFKELTRKKPYVPVSQWHFICPPGQMLAGDIPIYCAPCDRPGLEMDRKFAESIGECPRSIYPRNTGQPRDVPAHPAKHV